MFVVQLLWHFIDLNVQKLNFTTDFRVCVYSVNLLRLAGGWHFERYRSVRHVLRVVVSRSFRNEWA